MLADVVLHHQRSLLKHVVLVIGVGEYADLDLGLASTAVLGLAVLVGADQVVQQSLLRSQLDDLAVHEGLSDEDGLAALLQQEVVHHPVHGCPAFEGGRGAAVSDEREGAAL